jgi:aspartyl aminopeptidase
LTENPTIFHTVAYAKSKLDAAGYKQVSIPRVVLRSSCHVAY